MDTRKPLTVELLDPSLRQFNKVLSEAFNVDATKIEPAGKVYSVLSRFIETELFATDRPDQLVISELFEHFQKQLSEESWYYTHELQPFKALLSPAKFAMLNATLPLFKALTLLRWMIWQLQMLAKQHKESEQKARNCLVGVVTYAYKKPADNFPLMDLESKLKHLYAFKLDATKHPLITAYHEKLNQELNDFAAAKKIEWEDLNKLKENAEEKVNSFHRENVVFERDILRMTLPQGEESTFGATKKRLETIKSRITQLKANYKAQSGFFDESELSDLQELLKKEREAWRAEWRALCDRRAERIRARRDLELALLKERQETSQYILSAKQNLEAGKSHHFLSPAIKIEHVDYRPEYAGLKEQAKEIKKEINLIHLAQAEAQKAQTLIADYCKEMANDGLARVKAVLYTYPMAQYQTQLEQAQQSFIEQANNQYTIIGSQYYRLWSAVKEELGNLFSKFMPDLRSDIQYINSIDAQAYINGLISPLQKLGKELLDASNGSEKYAGRLQSALTLYATLFAKYEQDLNQEKKAVLQAAADEFERIKRDYLLYLEGLLSSVNGQTFELKPIKDLPEDPLKVAFDKAEKSLAHIKTLPEPKPAKKNEPSLQEQIREIERLAQAAKAPAPLEPAIVPLPVKPKQTSLWRRFWPQALAGTGGAGLGATVGFLMGMFFAPVTFGAAPWVFALIGAVLFASLGVFGVIGVKYCVNLHRKTKVSQLQPRKTSEIFSSLSIKPQNRINKKPPISPTPSNPVSHPTQPNIIPALTPAPENLSPPPMGLSRSQ